MPTEPEREIEKTLKAYADKRREQAGAPVELHPATRRLLQGEIARTIPFNAKKPAFWPTMMSVLRTRIAFVSAVMGLAAICAVILLPALSRPKTTLADKESVSSTQLAKLKAGEMKPVAKNETTPQPAAEPTVDRPRQLSPALENRGKDVAANRLVSPPPASTLNDEVATPAIVASPATPAPPPVTGSARAQGGAFKSTAAGAEALSASTTALKQPAIPAPVASSINGPTGGYAFNAPSSAPLAAAGVSTAASPKAPARQAKVASESARTIAQTGSSTQLFYRVQLSGTGNKPQASRRPAGGNILNTFRVEQNGGRLQIIDADGSAYSGVVQKTALALDSNFSGGVRPFGSDEKKQAAAEKLDRADALAKSLPGSAGETYYFRVAGTNRSLHQSVVFSGTLASATNAAVVPEGAVKRGIATGAMTPGLPFSHAQIQGRALIGGTNLIEIRAAPVPR